MAIWQRLAGVDQRPNAGQHTPPSPGGRRLAALRADASGNLISDIFVLVPIGLFPCPQVAGLAGGKVDGRVGPGKEQPPQPLPLPESRSIASVAIGLAARGEKDEAGGPGHAVEHAPARCADSGLPRLLGEFLQGFTTEGSGQEV